MCPRGIYLHNTFAGKQDSAERGHTDELDTVMLGVLQHGVSVRNKHPEGNRLANALGIVLGWQRMFCIYSDSGNI